ncbi:MAG TPA: hypothetical protein VHN14_20495 [Kofleriaceae bacterium]|nr:hypothetical protein [Kofleriaceae bacterium]
MATGRAMDQDPIARPARGWSAAGCARRWGVAGVLALAACQNAHRIEVLHDVAAVAAPRVFTWKLVAETAEMADGIFVTDREAWVVGPYGTILHTSNGGAARGDWQAVESNTTSQLGRIAAVTTAHGSFALVTGINVVVRYSSEHPSWEPLDLNPAIGRRPSLHVTDDGHVEAWLAMLDGFAYASDARTGAFTKATVPPGATEVMFSDDGDSWTVAPVGPECVPHRRVRGEVDWHPVPVPPRVRSPRTLSFQLARSPIRSSYVRGIPGLASASICADAVLAVTLERRKLWLITDNEVSEWDGKAWIRYEYPTDSAAAVVGVPPAGGIGDISDGDRKFMLFPQRTPPTLYAEPSLPAPDPAARPAARKDPHDRALAVWANARGVRFTVQDLWMQDLQAWAVGREGFVHTTDGGQTWTVTQAEPALTPPAATSGGAAGWWRPPGGNKAIGGTLLHTLAFDDHGTQGFAVADDGEVFHYDGAWHSQFKIDRMQHPLALDLVAGGHVAWLLTRGALYRLTTTGATIAATDDRVSMETLVVCPDGRSGWARYGGYHWYALDGAAWTKVATRPSLACLSESCQAALAQAEQGSVVCTSGDQIWSLRQGQTADGAVWQYPIPGLEPLQSHAAQIRADQSALPTRMIATSQDGLLLRTEGHTDQPSIVDPGATAKSSQVVLSWALSGTSAIEPTWVVEYCVVYLDDICARDSAAWVADDDLQQRVVGKRYAATVNPSKLSLRPDTKVQYRVRVAIGELRRKPLRIAEITLGESCAATLWSEVHLYVASVALWFLGLLALWLVAPRVVLHINDSVQKWVSQIPLFGNAFGAFTGVVLSRRLVRTPRVVRSWIRSALRASDPATGASAEAAGEPAGFRSLTDPDIRSAFQAMPACQQAWIALHLERAAKTFEGSKFAMERSAYGEVRVRVLTAGAARELAKGVGLEDLRELASPITADPRRVLWIRGQGGVGKSHLACRTARWLFKQALLPHPAIVIVIDGNTETREALDAMIRERLERLTQATDIDQGLVGHLLASGRVVPLFDGVTERSPRTMDVIHGYLESPQAPALTICTARSAHGLTARHTITLEPLSLDAEELLPFLSSYRLSLPAHQRRSEELLEPVRQAAKRIAEGERRTLLTPLLVTLLWDEAVAGAPFSSLAVEAFNGYVVRALVPAGDAADLAEPRRLALARARLLGQLALGKNYRPGRWFTRDAAANRLRDAGVGSADHDLLHDFIAAGLLEEDSPAGTQLRFLIDPLSEYLCALYILYSYDGNDPAWDQFLATLDALSPGVRTAADGFLIALADCWAAYGSSLQLTRAPRIDDVLPPSPGP